MKATQTENNSSLESVLAILQEVTERQQEITRRQEEIDIQLKEINRKIKEVTHQKDNDQKIKENVEQLDEDQLLEEEQIKEEIAEEQKKLWDKWVGDTLFFGDIADYMLLPFLFKKFSKLGLNFTVAQHNYYVSDDVNQISVSADFMLRNDDNFMLVKIKKELTAEHIKEHINRLEDMRKYADLGINKQTLLSIDKQTILGTVAGVEVTDEVKNYALNQGLYLIEPSGISFKIITPPNGKPKEW
jgi:DNA repair exonuclease SbcCD ATPase subunit